MKRIQIGNSMMLSSCEARREANLVHGSFWASRNIQAIFTYWEGGGNYLRTVTAYTFRRNYKKMKINVTRPLK